MKSNNRGSQPGEPTRLRSEVGCGGVWCVLPYLSGKLPLAGLKTRLSPSERSLRKLWGSKSMLSSIRRQQCRRNMAYFEPYLAESWPWPVEFGLCTNLWIGSAPIDIRLIPRVRDRSHETHERPIGDTRSPHRIHASAPPTKAWRRTCRSSEYSHHRPGRPSLWLPMAPMAWHVSARKPGRSAVMLLYRAQCSRSSVSRG